MHQGLPHDHGQIRSRRNNRKGEDRHQGSQFEEIGMHRFSFATLWRD
jgi:hypothetical protein